MIKLALFVFISVCVMAVHMAPQDDRIHVDWGKVESIAMEAAKAAASAAIGSITGHHRSFEVPTTEEVDNSYYGSDRIHVNWGKVGNVVGKIGKEAAKLAADAAVGSMTGHHRSFDVPTTEEVDNSYYGNDRIHVNWGKVGKVVGKVGKEAAKVAAGAAVGAIGGK